MSRSFTFSSPTPLVLALVLACGGDGSPTSDSDGSSSSTSGSTTGTTAETPTTGSTTAGTTTTGDQAIQTEVIRYTTQPMIVDVKITTTAPVDSLVLTHDSDPGVDIEAITVDGLATTFRVRGLAPDTQHTLTADVDGAPNPVAFITYPPLQGFIPSFAVEGGPVDPAVPYRMFDLIPFPAYDTASLFMVDAAGTTRFHYGGPSTGMPGPEGVYTAVQLRADGSVMYLHDHVMWIRDELGNTLTEISDDMLGVIGLHHELLELPNGNFMALSFVFEDIDYGAEGIVETAGDLIIEFTPAGELVWSWNSFDHLDPQRRLEPLSTTFAHPKTNKQTYDWTHANAIVYDEASDSLLLSLRHQDWILSIDHKTGEIQWKLGHDGDFTLAGAEYFFYHQHSPEWQPDGSLLLYDNALGNLDIPLEMVHSRAVRYELDIPGKVATMVWADDGEQVFVPYSGNSDRLPGGRILVTDSSILDNNGIHARLRELDPEASPMVQWSLLTPLATFAYRGSAHDRLIGRAKP